jgi:hypothetical protein
MMDDTKDQQNIYGSSDVAVLLKVKESTLRKYTLMLEKAGYEFDKNGYGQRGFYDRDVVALKKLIEIKNHPDMTLERACNAVMAWVRANSVSHSDITDITPQDHYNDQYINEIGELKQLVSQQSELIKAFAQQLDQKQRQFEERLQWMERDREFINNVRESMKQRQIESAEHENKTSTQLMNIESQLSDIQRKQNDNEAVKELTAKVEELTNQLQTVQKTVKESAAAKEEEQEKKKNAADKKSEGDELLRKSLEEMIAAAKEEQQKKRRKGIFKWFSKD